ncbi:LysR family transcriptional regulator [Mycobacteroides abscessus]|uniref:LysR family transcriptional regulator n=1 Tax=Mycobacteroides abscessus TaxID=36809 RepID=UPI000C2647C6|nr:LysR family transcriptional regulator [Mycobacteroides abscessus]AWG64765.1 LysR family transcriptional regulator [Mycobacteroides abscessus]RIS83603.1 LysR family transcriptional regulator [Mycobacteroides abscessus]
MEMRQLEYFVAAVEEGGFTRAAARMHVAQPAVSQQIGQLERSLGARLFDRSERRVRLTPEGEALLPYARAVLDAATAGHNAISALRGVLAGQLTIGSVASPPSELLTPLRAFQHQYPDVRITLRTNDSDTLVASVVDGSVDIALIGLMGARLSGGPVSRRLPAALGATALSDEPLVLAVAPWHPFATKTSITVAALRDHPIACQPIGSGLRTVLETACAEIGFTPNIRAETEHLSDLPALVAAGLGIAVIPISTATLAQPQITAVELHRPKLQRPLVLIWRRNRLPRAAIAFLEGLDTDDPQGAMGGAISKTDDK